MLEPRFNGIMAENLVSAMVGLEEKDSLRIVQEKMDAGEDPSNIIDDVRKAMEIVGKRYENCEYFLAELYLASDILSEIMEMVKPKLAIGAMGKRYGKIVIGTVAGDVHDIGKNIVTFLLDANGFEVHDLGTDVPPQKFVDKINEVKPEIVGLSGFLTLSFESMKQTIEAIKKAGLRDKIKIIIGGGVLDEKVREYVGADSFERFASGALSMTKKWIGSA